MIGTKTVLLISIILFTISLLIAFTSLFHLVNGGNGVLIDVLRVERELIETSAQARHTELMSRMSNWERHWNAHVDYSYGDANVEKFIEEDNGERGKDRTPAIEDYATDSQ